MSDVGDLAARLEDLSLHRDADRDAMLADRMRRASLGSRRASRRGRAAFPSTFGVGMGGHGWRSTVSPVDVGDAMYVWMQGSNRADWPALRQWMADDLEPWVLPLRNTVALASVPMPVEVREPPRRKRKVSRQRRSRKR